MYDRAMTNSLNYFAGKEYPGKKKNHSLEVGQFQHTKDDGSIPLWLNLLYTRWLPLPMSYLCFPR